MQSERRNVRRNSFVPLVVCWIGLISTQAFAKPEAPATATLPLARVLEMQSEIDRVNETVRDAPPVAATVHRIELSGQLLEEGIAFEARYDIDVLDGEAWVEIPLLRRDAGTHLLDLPTVPGGSFRIVDGTLRFVTKQKKRHQFSLSLLKEATVEGDRRSLRIELAEASVSNCKLTFDEELFALANQRVLSKSDGVLVLPTDDAFQIEWIVKESITAKAVQNKPDIASVVSGAYASSVSTLEGTRITRVLYRLRFAGRKTIEFEMPEGQRVERAYLNGFAVPVEMDGGALRIEAAPERAGDESATVELVYTAEEGVYHLAGSLLLRLPRVSWPMNEVFLSLRLPEVFTYEWKGGSLSPGSKSALPKFTYQIPGPGKEMSFHQYLVSRHAPHVSLDYAVDLENQYFCAQ